MKIIQFKNVLIHIERTLKIVLYRYCFMLLRNNIYLNKKNYVVFSISYRKIYLYQLEKDIKQGENVYNLEPMTLNDKNIALNIIISKLKNLH